MLAGGVMIKVEKVLLLEFQMSRRQDIFPKILFSTVFFNRSKLAILQSTHNKLLQEYHSALKMIEEIRKIEVFIQKKA
jgi:hypothetical protein